MAKMNRNEALKLLKKYVKQENLIKHCVATAAVMKEIAKYLGEDEAKWELIGILHDIDYEIVDGDMSKHGLRGAEILSNEKVDEDVVEVVKTHNHTIFGDYKKPEEIALQAADSVSGLIIAAALVKKGRLSDVTPKTIKKKFKDKSFAAGCDRNRIREIEKLNIELPKLYELGIRGLLDVKEELGLE